jgi:D-tyrosyl-tRNA(Tyr) deacylase
MIALIQRVASAAVTVEHQIVGQIAHGLLVLAAVHADDSHFDIDWTAQKLLTLRIFPLADKAYDLDIAAAAGSLLVVSNFTLAAETAKGRRPSLNPAAPPEKARPLFDLLLARLRQSPIPLATGIFAADMQITLTNDGPTTFLLDSRPARPPIKPH